MNALVSLLQRAISTGATKVGPALFSKFNKVFGTNVKNVGGATAALSKLAPSRKTITDLVNVIGTGWLGYEVSNLSDTMIRQIASTESEKLGTTELANLIRSAVNIADGLLGATYDKDDLAKAAGQILDGNISNNDGDSKLSAEDMYLEENARIAQRVAYTEVRSGKVRDIADKYNSMKNRLTRASQLLGLTPVQTIELAELLRDIDLSYEGLI